MNSSKKWRAMDKTANKIDKSYGEGGRSHEIALLTLALCCDWSESNGASELSREDAEGPIRQYVDKGLASTTKEEMGWIKTFTIWLLMKFVIPWVIQNYLDDLYNPDTK
jgi:hypothetical protein